MPLRKGLALVLGGLVAPSEGWAAPAWREPVARLAPVGRAAAPRLLDVSSSQLLQQLDAPLDGFRYAFMLPTATLVATCCQLAGIGGAALFSPIFLLVFPLLGPEYPLASPAAAIASALLTEVFGFASGLSGYARRGLVAWPVALQYSALAVPAALVGALAARYLAADPAVLRGAYAALMLGLVAFLTLSPAPAELASLADEECELPASGAQGGRGPTSELPAPTASQLAASGERLTYLVPPKGSAGSSALTGGGALLTGLLGVGVGECVLPQLLRASCMPLPLAAGTSVAVVVVTAAAAATVQFASLAAAAGDDIGAVVPWSLVAFTIPGVLLGGQLAPWLASKRVLSDAQVEAFAAALFGVVGVAFAAKAVLG